MFSSPPRSVGVVDDPFFALMMRKCSSPGGIISSSAAPSPLVSIDCTAWIFPCVFPHFMTSGKQAAIRQRWAANPDSSPGNRTHQPNETPYRTPPGKKTRRVAFQWVSNTTGIVPTGPDNPYQHPQSMTLEIGETFSLLRGKA